MRVLVGGIGYRNLRDHSFGVLVVETLAGRVWPDGVAVEDVSYNPIAVVQRLEDDPPERRFERAVLVSAVQRPGRAPGGLTIYRWNGSLPGASAIQAAVAEAVTGVIALDNTLIIARHFGVLPPQVLVIEFEPVVHEFGDALSPEGAAAFERACAIVASAAGDEPSAWRLPETPLGGGGLRMADAVVPRISHVR